MTTLIAATNEVLLSADEQSAAHDFMRSFEGRPPRLASEEGAALPAGVARALELVLEAMSEGRPVSVTTMPENLTTTTAAGLLGVSRPTLMKFVREERIPTYKVGSHHRLRSADVLALLDELRLERQQAVFELMDLEEDLTAERP